MGGIESKDKKRSGSSEKECRRKVKHTQEEMSERRKESASYERDMMVYVFKGAEWKQEKKKMREEVKMLRKLVEEKEKTIRGRVVDEQNKSNGVNNEATTTNMLIEQMRVERARRDETVEKWKQLYLAIKMELDKLIQRTHCEDGLYWRAEEDIIVEELKRELKAKEEVIARLNSKIVSMEKEQCKRDREIDILRQTLRIMSCKKTVQRVSKNVSRDSQLVKNKPRKMH